MIASLYQRGSVALASFFTLRFSGLVGCAFSCDLFWRGLFWRSQAAQPQGFIVQPIAPPGGSASRLANHSEEVRRLNLGSQRHEVSVIVPRVPRPRQKVFDDEVLVGGNAELV